MSTPAEYQFGWYDASNACLGWGLVWLMIRILALVFGELYAYVVGQGFVLACAYGLHRWAARAYLEAERRSTKVIAQQRDDLAEQVRHLVQENGDLNMRLRAIDELKEKLAAERATHQQTRERAERVKPVFQTKATNCLSAAVATVLGLELDRVPEWWDLTGDAWINAIVEWAQSIGYGVCYFDLKDLKSWPILANHLVIVGGDTPRSERYLHCVVARAEYDGKTTKLHWVHDPCRGGDFITNPDHCLFFVKDTALSAKESSDGKPTKEMRPPFPHNKHHDEEIDLRRIADELDRS